MQASPEDLAKVQKIIAGQLAKDEAKILPETTFKELDADSLDTVRHIGGQARRSAGWFTSMVAWETGMLSDA